MRTNINVQTGQVWMSSDPRRLRKFRLVSTILRATDNHPSGFVVVQMVYPNAGRLETVSAQGFEQTGTKGYTRVS